MDGRFTSEELAIAKSTDLVEIASRLGYTPQRIGKYYTLKEMDSIRIYNRSHWYRWSGKNVNGHSGGSQIDFLQEFADMDVKEAVFWLLDLCGYKRSEDIKPVLKHQVSSVTAPRKEFVLPKANIDNNRIYQYLCNDRGLSKDIVDYFVKQGLIYESENYHNVVFKGNDKDGVTRFASMRGIYDRNGKKFRCDVAGNDKRYGFNVHTEASDEVNVFEACIDMMSYMDIFGELNVNCVALGMTGDAPLETFLREYPHIRLIRFCLDGDEPGMNAMMKYHQKYITAGYEVIVSPPPVGYKDYNEWLVSAKEKYDGMKKCYHFEKMV